jgi:hypothetical protein
MVQSPGEPTVTEVDGRSGILETPPSERLWQRYSPHHELPLSGISSLAVHGLLFAVLVVGGLVVSQMFGQADKGPAIGVVALAGDGSDFSARNASGQTGQAEEVVPSATPTTAPSADHPTDLHPPQPKALDVLPTGQDSRPVPVPDPSKELRNLSDDAAKKLRGPRSKTGSRQRPQTGDERARAKIQNERQQRLLRWTMTFSTADGSDYLRQLKSLGAILAYQGAHGDYVVIRDLDKRPARGQVESLESLDRIYWIDDRIESVKSLAKALQIPAPKLFIAFFPESLEKELLRKELAYAGRKEEAIHETKFTVKRTPSGYEPVVASQTANE